MNRKRLWGLAICVLWAVTGCREELNRQLQGKWQLKTVERAGYVSKVDTVWYNFQSESLFMYQIYRADRDTFMHLYGFKTRPEENGIQLELISYPSPVEAFLPFTDWKERIRTFTVEKINGKRLVLHGDDATYEFVQF
ncbi:MAG: lipocalin-like domain-containing protein [Tannerella sp.]|jgi:hypothetical protein|nr:lipocalin-like domain-containing protein [Tannerella sp.]